MGNLFNQEVYGDLRWYLAAPLPAVLPLGLFYPLLLLLMLGVLVVGWFCIYFFYTKKYCKVVSNSGNTFFLRKDAPAFPVGKRRARCYLQHNYIPSECSEAIHLDGEKITVAPLKDWRPRPGDRFYRAYNFDQEADQVIPQGYRSWHPVRIVKVY